MFEDKTDVQKRAGTWLCGFFVFAFISYSTFPETEDGGKAIRHILTTFFIPLMVTGIFSMCLGYSVLKVYGLILLQLFLCLTLAE